MFYITQEILAEIKSNIFLEYFNYEDDLDDTTMEQMVAIAEEITGSKLKLMVKKDILEIK